MTDTPTTKSRRVLSELEIFGAMTKLHAYLRGPVSGLWTYAEGYSDQVVADEMGNGVTVTNIAGLRERNFGKLAKGGDGGRDLRVDHLIAAHDALVRDIAAGTFTVGSAPEPYLVGATS
jgi:hypothetical protein